MLKRIIKRIINVKVSLKSKEGFSLIEVMIAVTIIAIMSATIGPKLYNMVKKSSVTATKQQMQALKSALTNYYMNNNKFPTTDEGLQALVTDKIMKSVPKDKWKRDFIYRSPAEDSEKCTSYEIISLGEDGREGGKSYAADITLCE